MCTEKSKDRLVCWNGDSQFSAILNESFLLTIYKRIKQSQDHIIDKVILNLIGFIYSVTEIQNKFSQKNTLHESIRSSLPSNSLFSIPLPRYPAHTLLFLSLIPHFSFVLSLTVSLTHAQESHHQILIRGLSGKYRAYLYISALALFFIIGWVASFKVIPTTPHYSGSSRCRYTAFLWAPFSILVTSKRRREVCRDCTKAVGAVQSCVSPKIAAQDPINALARYRGEEASHRTHASHS